MVFRQHPTTAAPRRAGLALLGLLLALGALLLAVNAGAGAAAPRYQATTPASGAAASDAPVTGTAVLAAPVRTDLPQAVSTGQAVAPAPASSVGPGGVATPATAANSDATNPNVATPPPAQTPPDSSPPWPWIIGGLVLLAILGGAAYMFTRRPAGPAPAAALAPAGSEAPTVVLPDTPAPDLSATPAPVVAPTATMIPPEATAAPPETPSLVPSVPAAAADVAAAAPAPAPTPAPAAPAPRATAAPTMVKCPNCDTMNPIDRRYCDECGQDLRAAVAAALAGPLPEVEATTPYLETLSRVDEQLEFVLARDAITIGRALDNDIVIDDQFIGWQTVSPRHAELKHTANGFVLRDLNSENGTFVNSARTGENLLQDGMTIAFGKVEFIYRVPTE